MEVVNSLITALWLVFIGYWAATARAVKKDIMRTGPWWRWALIVSAVMFFFSSRVPKWHLQLFPRNMVTEGATLALTAAGISIAIWARRHLGANWSSAPSLKEGHVLVTSGPYRLVRHPIYAGILVALLGSGLAGSAIWLYIFAVFCAIFLYRARVEEQLMLGQFPDEYREYRKRTKALIPFLL